jgi:hypothetical protein
MPQQQAGVHRREQANGDFPGEKAFPRARLPSCTADERNVIILRPTASIYRLTASFVQLAVRLRRLFGAGVGFETDAK